MPSNPNNFPTKLTEGADLMNQIFSGGIATATPAIVQTVRLQVSEACEELLDIGARIRPLLVGDKRVGWVRGLHMTERKILNRWYSDKEFVEYSLLLATSLTQEQLNEFSGREIFHLAKLVKQMTEHDLSLAPYMTAFASTSTSEYLWYGKGRVLTSFENKIVSMPDGANMKILSPSHQAKLWGTLCSYREQNKVRLDNMMNAAMIVRPQAGHSIDPLVAELKMTARNMQADSSVPWESVVSARALGVQHDDGWAHPDDTKEGLIRELHGMLAGDKHEQAMDAFMRTQLAAAEAETKRIESLHKQRGGPGVSQKEGITVHTPAEIREREKKLKKGIPTPRDTEISPTAGERITKYQ
jgi:hypothetical protein